MFLDGARRLAFCLGKGGWQGELALSCSVLSGHGRLVSEPVGQPAVHAKDQESVEHMNATGPFADAGPHQLREREDRDACASSPAPLTPERASIQPRAIAYKLTRRSGSHNQEQQQANSLHPPHPLRGCRRYEPGNEGQASWLPVPAAVAPVSARALSHLVAQESSRPHTTHDQATSNHMTFDCPGVLECPLRRPTPRSGLW